jgi:HD-GYP domain-containing protein (c-di-GMP phosphodiesterase class II)
LDERRLETVSCLVNAVVDSVIKDIECISLLAEIKSASDDMYMHSVDVARISLITGINMNFNVSELVNLCKAALLHDIGKLEFLKKAPNYIKEHPYEYKRHPLLGYEKLKQSNNFETSVYVSVLQHHERYDGNGYPRGMKGINITIFAKIISIADFYANMLQAAERKYSKSEILEVLYADFSKQFDPKILSIFVSKFPLYEIGEIVSLSTGDTAIVVQNNEECIARPIVRVLNKNKELGSEINLFKTLNITIL